MNPSEYLLQTANESIEIKQRFLKDCGETLVAASRAIGHSIQNGGKLLICGNGGSAADAQHMAAEMVGRMLIDRRPLPAIALTTDSSNLTAIANDFGYDVIFSKQVEALLHRQDVLLAISTSGNSSNVVRAVEVAREKGATVITLTGGTGGKLQTMGQFSLNVALGKNSSRIQETHIFAIHSLVDLLDRFFLEG